MNWMISFCEFWIFNEVFMLFTLFLKMNFFMDMWWTCNWTIKYVLTEWKEDVGLLIYADDLLNASFGELHSRFIHYAKFESINSIPVKNTKKIQKRKSTNAQKRRNTLTIIPNLEQKLGYSSRINIFSFYKINQK